MPVAASTVSARVAQNASSNPPAAPSMLSAALSVSIWRTSRPRSAPIAARKRELAQPAGAARQQQVRDVRARHQQHDDHGGRRAAAAPAAIRRPSSRAAESTHHALIGVVGRILLLEPGGDRLELGARLLDRDAVLQPRDAADEVAAAIGLRGIEPERREHVGGALGIDLEMAEVAGSTPITVAGTRVQRDRLADDRRDRRRSGGARIRRSARPRARAPGRSSSAVNHAAERRLHAAASGRIPR